MKNRKIAIALAFFTGFLGLHRFYLGQPVRGVLYLILLPTLLSLLLGLIDFVVFLGMSDEAFSLKYNKKDLASRGSNYHKSYEKKRYTGESSTGGIPMPGRHKTTIQKPIGSNAALKKEGLQLYRDFHYAEAIDKFEQALQINPYDFDLHFQLACAYSLTENAVGTFKHLHFAVANGYNSLDTVGTHEALAFIRVHPLFEDFRNSQFTQLPSEEEIVALTKKSQPSQALPSPDPSPDLLEELKQLERLHLLGILTDEEYAQQKSKLPIQN